MDIYAKLAKDSLEYFVKTGRFLMDQEAVPQEMKDRRAGVFITILKDGEERGYNGTILPVHANVGDEIIECAVCAGIYDMRFDRIKEEELDSLTYRVDILSKPEYVETLEPLDPAVYGIVVSGEAMDRGVALPGLVEGETVDEQLARAMEAGGMPAGEQVQVERFTVERHIG